MKPSVFLLVLLLAGCGGAPPSVPEARKEKKEELLLPLDLAAPFRRGLDRELLASSARLLRLHWGHADYRVREEASIALEALGPHAVQYAALLFSDEHPEVVWRVHRALARAGWPSQELLDLAAEGGPSAAPLLAQVLKERTMERAGPAIAALARLGPPSGEVRGALEALLSEPEALTRYHAARALGVLGDPAAAAALERLGQDEDQGVRFAAAGALKRLGKPEAHAILMKTQELNAQRGGNAASVGFYNQACLAALSGDTQEALERLAAACAAGFHDPAAAVGDPDLYDLRELPGWQALMRNMLQLDLPDE